jgi:photosystem II stability/assembly factor-like uncharacterized protein
MAISCWCVAGRAGENVWSNNGPGGGTIHSIAIHPRDHRTVYVGTIQNGIYLSTDGGEHWVHTSPDLAQRSVYAVAIHPLGPDTIYAATVQGLFKSSDTGRTWELLPGADGPRMMYRPFVIHPVLPNILFTASLLYGWKSTDGGQSWHMLMVPGPVPGRNSVECIVVDPARPNIVYLAGPSDSFGRALWKSTDYGDTWFQCQNNIDSVGHGHTIEIDPVDSDILYYGRYRDDLSGKCLWKTTDGGESWFDITPSNSPISDIADIVVMPDDHSVVFLCTGLGGLLKSTDGGQSWARSDSGAYAKSFISMAVDTVGNALFLGTVDKGIYKSTDEGASWRPISQYISLLPCHGFAISPFDPRTILVFDPTGHFGSTDRGETWQYYPLSSRFKESPANGAFDDLQPGLAYMSLFPHRWLVDTVEFARSVDNGLSWIPASGPPGGADCGEIAISYQGGGRRIFLASSHGIYRSDDAGLTWILCDQGLPTGVYFGAVEASPSNPNVIAAADFLKRIYVSSDRGQNWANAGALPRHSDEYSVYLQFDPLNSSVLYAATDYYGLFKSLDCGGNWININNDLPMNSYISVSAPAINPYNSQHMFVYSNNYGVYETRDGGAHWISFNAGLDTARCFGPIYFAPGDTTRLYLATLNASVWSIHRTLTGVEEEEPNLPRSITLSAYPNPFNSATTFTTNLEDDFTIDIFDITGGRIASLTARGGKAIWDASAYSSGVYFARAHNGIGERVIKIILLK